MEFGSTAKWNAFQRFRAEGPTDAEEGSLLGKQKLAPSDGDRSLSRSSPSLKRSPSAKKEADGQGNFRWLVLPESQFRTAWIQIQLIVALYIIWVTPVRVGFNLPAEGVWFWFEGVIDIFFYVDMALNFITAYEDHSGEVVTDRKAITMRYLKGWFAIDLLATFPVDYILRAAEGTWLCSLQASCIWSMTQQDYKYSAIHMLRILRIFRIIWILKHFRFMNFRTLLGSLADELYHIMPYMSILELLIVLLYLGHISGCFFYLLSTPPWRTAEERNLIARGDLNTWMHNAFGGDKLVMLPQRVPPPAGAVLANGTLNATAIPQNTVRDNSTGIWYTCSGFGYAMRACNGCAGVKLRCYTVFKLPFRYITSMYWAYTTMTTVGYGDISSVTYAEKVWAITTMIVSGFFFSFVVGRMASVISKLDSTRSAYNDQLDMLTTFMKDTDLPRQLSARVLNHFRRQKVKPYDRQQVLSALPFELRCKILRHLYASAIHAVPLLHRMADDDVFLTDVCLRLQAYSCSSQSYLYQRGETGGDVFILLRGELVMLDLDQTTLLFKISPGTVFGEGSVIRHLEGIAKAKRTDNVFARTECSLLRITAEDMLDLLDQYPQLLDTLRALHNARTYKQQLLKVPPGSSAADGQGAEDDGQAAAAQAGEDNAPGALRALRTKEEPKLLDVDDALTPHAPNRPGEPSAIGSNTAQPPNPQQVSAASQQDSDFGQFIKAVPSATDGQGQPGRMHQVPSYPNAASVFGFIAANGVGQQEAAAAAGTPGARPLDTSGLSWRGSDVSKLLAKGASLTVPAGAGSFPPAPGVPTHSNSEAHTPAAGAAAIAAGAGLGTAAALQAVVAELSAIRELLSQQQAALQEKVDAQQLLLAELPGRLVTHLSMVLPEPQQAPAGPAGSHSTGGQAPRSTTASPQPQQGHGSPVGRGDSSTQHGPAGWLHRQRSGRDRE